LEEKMTKHENIIAIDPDVDKSGVAFLERSSRKLELSSLTFFQLFDYLSWVTEQNKPFIVLIEAGWLNEKSNFHQVKNQRSSDRISKNVGANHEVGKLIVSMCEYLKIEHEVRRPLLKMWSGTNRKITHEELEHFTGIMGQTNQETRDAALLAWDYAGLPIKIKAVSDCKRVTCK
jgi:hypothetical protein